MRASGGKSGVTPMLKNITIGQYFRGDSPIHRMDPRLKLILVIAYIVLLFVASGIVGMLLCLAAAVAFYLIARVPLKMIVKSLKPIIPIILFTAILNAFFVEGDVLFSWWIFTVSKQGVLFAIVMTLRLIALIAGSSLLTYTTSPIQLTDGLELLMSPLKKIHFPAHELAMMMTIALRFIPTLIEETGKIMNAQKARGADLETGGLMQRIKALVPILIPLFISAFRRADELAIAMECRCYHGGEGRTRMKKLTFHLVDLWGLLVMAALFVGILTAVHFIPPITF